MPWTRQLMLDSGAFSVWAQGAFSKKKASEKNIGSHKIDLQKYIQFCEKYPEVTYYVNLDVIPGKPRDPRSLTQTAIHEACCEGYSNWKEMCRYLPKKQVIPVFHQYDDVYWLQKYMGQGADYIGISPANDQTVVGKLQWMRSVKPYIFDKDNNPLVKTHGFAVTTYHLMRYWHWYSVDSASWKLWAGWGIIYLPQKTGGEFDYSKDPLIIAMSPASKKVAEHQQHYLHCSPSVKENMQEYLDSCGLELGDYTTKVVEDGYKLVRPEPGEGEVWRNRRDRKVLVPTTCGVMTSFRERCKANVRFMLRAEDVLPVKHIYFAGAPMPYLLEYKLGNRLLSFAEIGKTGESECLERHLRVMRGEEVVL